MKIVDLFDRAKEVEDQGIPGNKATIIDRVTKVVILDRVSLPKRAADRTTEGTTEGVKRGTKLTKTANIKVTTGSTVTSHPMTDNIMTDHKMTGPNKGVAMTVHGVTKEMAIEVKTNKVPATRTEISVDGSSTGEDMIKKVALRRRLEIL